MKLYYSPGACSQAPHIVLRELKKKFDLEKVDLGSKLTDGGKDFNKINAKSYVPTLEIKKGEVLTEVAIILQYLADKTRGGSKLLPKAGTMNRYRAMEALNFVSSELHKSIGGLFNKAMPDAGKEVMKMRVNQRLTYLNNHLAKNKYLTGKSYQVADAYAFVAVSWTKYVGVDLAPYPNVQRYLETIAKRPAVQATLKAEGLI